MIDNIGGKMDANDAYIKVATDRTNKLIKRN